MAVYIAIRDITVLSWLLTGAATLLTIGRYAIRHKKIGNFYYDDVAHALALMFLIAVVAVFTTMFPVLFQVDGFGRGERGPPSASQYLFFLKMQLAVSVLWWMCLYSVKLAFLLLFRTLFGVSKTFNRQWWGVVAFTALTFAICIAGELTACGSLKDLLEIESCQSPAAARHFRIVLDYSCVAHTLSDLAIMALPLYSLKDLKMRTRQKLALASIFCLAILIIAFDIVRTVISVNGGAVGAQSALWCILEASIAVIVSCLPAYRSLFTSGERMRRRRYIELMHPARAIKCQPSRDFNSPLKMEDSIGKEYGTIKMGTPESSVEDCLDSTIYLDAFDRVKLPEAVHIVGAQSHFLVTTEG